MTEHPPEPSWENYPPPPSGGYPPPQQPGGYPPPPPPVGYQQPPPGSYPPPPQGGGYPPVGAQGYGVQPSSNLVWGILVTIFCCLPFGIVSIVKANQVGSLWVQGRYADAQKASGDARTWAIVGAAIGIVLHIILASYYASHTGS